MILPPPAQPESPRRTRIKICGITSIEMALAAVEAGADAIGLVHVKDSPRFLTSELADEIEGNLPLTVQAVSVFRNAPIKHVAEFCAEVVQLHGDEDEEYIAKLRRLLPDVPLIRAVAFNENEVRRWDGGADVDALLIEGSRPGDGAAFVHEELASLMGSITKPVLLAGGLTPKNVAHAIRTVKPYGVDVSSGVESSRGVKDAGLIREFCAAVREADQS